MSLSCIVHTQSIVLIDGNEDVCCLTIFDNVDAVLVAVTSLLQF